MFFVVLRKFDEYVARMCRHPNAVLREIQKEDPNAIEMFCKSGGRFWVLRRVVAFTALTAEGRARLAHDAYALRDWCESV